MGKTPTATEAEGFFKFEHVGSSIDALETPAPIIDFDVMLANLIRWQKHCDAAGIANWPHIKTHKLVPVAQLQVALGAKGLAVQKRILGHLVGYYSVEVGPLNQVVHLWAYDSLDERAKRRAALWADPEWLAYVNEPAAHRKVA